MTGLRQTIFPKHLDAAEMKRRAWRKYGMIAVDLTDPNLNLSWPDRELLRTIAERLHGPSEVVKVAK